MESRKAELIDQLIGHHQQFFQTMRPIVPHEWLEMELTMSQLKVALYLTTEGPSRVSALAAFLGVSTATMTGIADRLVQHDFIIRHHDPTDRRAVICELSDKGKMVINRMWEVGTGRTRQLLEKMTEDQLEHMRQGVADLLAAAEELNREEAEKHPAPTESTKE